MDPAKSPPGLRGKQRAVLARLLSFDDAGEPEMGDQGNDPDNKFCLNRSSIENTTHASSWLAGFAFDAKS